MKTIEFAVLFQQPEFSQSLRSHKDKTPMIRAAMHITMLQGCTIYAPEEALLVEVGPLVLEPPLLVAFVAFCSIASR